MHCCGRRLSEGGRAHNCHGSVPVRLSTRAGCECVQEKNCVCKPFMFKWFIASVFVCFPWPFCRLVSSSCVNGKVICLAKKNGEGHLAVVCSDLLLLLLAAAGGDQSVGVRRVGAQNIALFSPSLQKFHSLCSLWASSRGISMVFEVLGPSTMHVWSSLGHRVRGPAGPRRGGLPLRHVKRLAGTSWPLAESELWRNQTRLPTPTRTPSSLCHTNMAYAAF